MAAPEARAPRLPGLDGLRAVSIGEVMLSHLAQTSLAPWLPLFLATPLATRGGWGVVVFFVISGYLITFLLLTEERVTGRISLSRFYGRRALRILPPAFVYLIVIAALAALAGVMVTRTELLASAFFFRNMTHAPDAYTEHFWSLSIEEQFYVCWPLLLKFTPRKLRFPLMAMLCAAAPVWRHLNVAFWGADWRRADLWYDSLLMGALVAVVSTEPAWTARIDRWLSRPALVFAAALVALFVCLYEPWTIPGTVVLALTLLKVFSIAVIVLIIARGQCKPVQAFLNARWMVWIGLVSYSLYIWQQPFLRAAGGSALQRFPVNLIAVFAAAALSYYLIERPCFRLRQRLAVGRSSANPTAPSAGSRSRAGATA